MKKKLSFTLLTLSILSTNILPGQAATKNIGLNLGSSLLQNKRIIIGQGKWCLKFPQTGLLCWNL